MRWPLSILLLSAVASGQSIPAGLLPPTDATATIAPALPALPTGRSTVMGGEIDKVDLVRDQFSLKVAGGRAINILFDERTQVYENGKKISILALHPEDHASVETTLDGKSVFALRIHALSALPDGQVYGQILNYNQQTGELKLQVADSKSPTLITVSKGIPVRRSGQRAFSQQNATGSADLVRGAVVEVTFKSDKSGQGAATSIKVFAVPGAEFVVRGYLTFLDLRTGRMSISNEATDHPIDIMFEPSRFAVSHDLHQGLAVTVTVRFDGTRYTATNIATE